MSIPLRLRGQSLCTQRLPAGPQAEARTHPRISSETVDRDTLRKEALRLRVQTLNVSLHSNIASSISPVSSCSLHRRRDLLEILLLPSGHENLRSALAKLEADRFSDAARTSYNDAAQRLAARLGMRHEVAHGIAMPQAGDSRCTTEA
eukprot:3234002-Rhodomonas_salina.1